MTNSSVSLRPWLKSDIKYFNEWLNDHEVMKYLGDPFPSKSYESIVRYYEERVLEPHRYIIIENETSLPIGSCRLFNINHKDSRCELSLFIGNKIYWGKGYGKYAVELCKKIAFKGLNINRLELYCFSSNERAVSLYKKCGFQIDGILREYTKLDGSYQNVILMSILYSEFQDE